MVRAAKREAVSTRSGGNGVAESSNGNSNNDSSSEEDVLDRRFLRSRYLNVKSRICDEKDDLSKADSDKFTSIFEEVERLHEKVQNPREQVADAEALLDITNTLVTSVKAHSNEGVTPTDFLSCLLREFGDQVGISSSTDASQNSICWEEVGFAVSNVFKSAPGCCTMTGPMTCEVKPRKPVVQRKRVRPTGNERPEELPESEAEKNTDTDKNMATMFQILRKHRRVRLEALLLNRRSFAQTVENLFALSFLAKDGRAQITVDDKGVHTVGPRNAPSANAVLSGEVSYKHFVFRFDFNDWKLMLASVEVGEELMPHRNEDVPDNFQPALTNEETTERGPSTPIRKLSRNRGLVLQEQTVVEDSPEGDDSGARAAAIRKGKRKLGI
ncbi:PREDICTED: non-structural maintenance of chromosomes element 4 homolog A-like [Ipomoea nil]|uniref:non-structural maintenance of chromosomes element 4 homolog A-like n=1 Tax=Ipomoea nil TaxID=35883 RepID=UPI0009015F9E|nr:PREDICTED: non-structural maintenance of chromosomes element 4 homolog A-like [Ipomoea nil]